PGDYPGAAPDPREYMPDNLLLEYISCAKSYPLEVLADQGAELNPLPSSEVDDSLQIYVQT
ncbi:MAG: hypothetical protein WBM78_11430, partial [Desulfobacterales bacterium]